MIRSLIRHRLAAAALLGLWAAGTLLSATEAEARFGKSRPKPTLDLIETLEADGRFGTLLFALDATQLTDTVKNAEALTVFAPTDDAFDTLPDGVLDDLVANPDALTEVLLYHVLPGRVRAGELRRGTIFETLLAPQPVAAFRDDRDVRINGIVVENANVRASNGIAHVLDEGVLIPPGEDFEVNSVVDVLELDGRFTTLIDLVAAANLADTLVNGGPFTLFAPTDEAFAQVPPEVVEALLADEELLVQVLTYHLLPGKQNLFSLLLKGGAVTVEGSRVEVEWTRDGVEINDSELTAFDEDSPNATINVIDEVLSPPPAPDAGILEELEAEGYTTLVAAIEAAGIAGDLLALGPVTILAPTNEAFAALGDEALADLIANPEALANILVYHVIVGEQSLIDLAFDRTTETVQGSTVRTRFFFFFGSFINNARVVDADNRLTGATVHGIDEVLIPPN